MAELPSITSPTREAIFAAYEADAGDGFRAHLGASLIGKECEADFLKTVQVVQDSVCGLFNEVVNRRSHQLVW